MITKVVLATVVGALNWSDLPRKEVIITGDRRNTVKFTTTSSTTYKGYFGGAATSSTGHLTRRMWFSEEPGGNPIQQFYRSGRNACDVAGVEIKLSWSQEPSPKFPTTCKLKPNTVYYLNHAQYAYGDGPEPTAKSSMIRSSSVSGKP